MSSLVTRNGGFDPQRACLKRLYQRDRTSSTHQSPQTTGWYRYRTPGSAATPYIVGRKPNAPPGVVRSPSSLRSEMPRCPSHAVHAPAAGYQQEPRFRQSRSEPWVDARSRATTVTSWVAAPVEASSLASVAGQAAAAVRAPP